MVIGDGRYRITFPFPEIARRHNGAEHMAIILQHLLIESDGLEPAVQRLTEDSGDKQCRDQRKLSCHFKDNQDGRKRRAQPYRHDLH